MAYPWERRRAVHVDESAATAAGLADAVGTVKGAGLVDAQGFTELPDQSAGVVVHTEQRPIVHATPAVAGLDAPAPSTAGRPARGGIARPGLRGGVAAHMAETLDGGHTVIVRKVGRQVAPADQAMEPFGGRAAPRWRRTPTTGADFPPPNGTSSGTSSTTTDCGCTQ